MGNNSGWKTLDVRALLARREEATTTANVGSYPVPLGQPLRRTPPLADGPVERLAAADPEYARALRAMGWVVGEE
jgi:hypothetical protein